MIDITTVTIKRGTGSADLNPIPITPDLGVTVTVTLKEVALDHISNPHATEAQAHTITNETPHTADPHHTGVSPETTVDLGHTHHAKLQSNNLEDQRQEIQAGHH